MSAKAKHKYKNVVMTVAVLFAVSWASTVVAAMLFVTVYAKNAKLAHSLKAMENKLFVITMKDEKDRESNLAKNRSLEDETLRYLQWQFVLKDQVSESGRRLLNQIAAIKELEKNRELGNLLYYNLGLNYTLALDFNSAVGAYEKAAQIKPDDANSCYNLGLLYSVRKDNSQAVKWYKKFLALSPASPKAREVEDRVKAMEEKR
jgi:tetratricopeptide (TPR) repeat protein